MGDSAIMGILGMIACLGFAGILLIARNNVLSRAESNSDSSIVEDMSRYIEIAEIINPDDLDIISRYYNLNPDEVIRQDTMLALDQTHEIFTCNLLVVDNKIEAISVLYNPDRHYLLSSNNKKQAKQEALEIINKWGISDEMLDKITSVLSAL